MTITVHVFAFLLLDCGQQSARGTLHSTVDTALNKSAHADLMARCYKGIQDCFEVGQILHWYFAGTIR